MSTGVISTFVSLVAESEIKRHAEAQAQIVSLAKAQAETRTVGSFASPPPQSPSKCKETRDFPKEAVCESMLAHNYVISLIICAFLIACDFTPTVYNYNLRRTVEVSLIKFVSQRFLNWKER